MYGFRDQLACNIYKRTNLKNGPKPGGQCTAGESADCYSSKAERSPPSSGVVHFHVNTYLAQVCQAMTHYTLLMGGESQLIASSKAMRFL